MSVLYLWRPSGYSNEFKIISVNLFLVENRRDTHLAWQRHLSVDWSEIMQVNSLLTVDKDHVHPVIPDLRKSIFFKRCPYLTTRFNLLVAVTCHMTASLQQPEFGIQIMKIHLLGALPAIGSGIQGKKSNIYGICHLFFTRNPVTSDL